MASEEVYGYSRLLPSIVSLSAFPLRCSLQKTSPVSTLATYWSLSETKYCIIAAGYSLVSYLNRLFQFRLPILKRPPQFRRPTHSYSPVKVLSDNVHSAYSLVSYLYRQSAFPFAHAPVQAFNSRISLSAQKMPLTC